MDYGQRVAMLCVRNLVMRAKSPACVQHWSAGLVITVVVAPVARPAVMIFVP
jgi:hypothetical protein